MTILDDDVSGVPRRSTRVYRRRPGGRQPAGGCVQRRRVGPVPVRRLPGVRGRRPGGDRRRDRGRDGRRRRRRRPRRRAARPGFDGRTGGLVREFFAFSPGLHRRVFVAAGGPERRWPGRRRRRRPGPAAGRTSASSAGRPGRRCSGFFAYDLGFTGGVSVAAGDVTGDGRAEIIIGAGPGGGPHVKVFDGRRSRWGAAPASPGQPAAVVLRLRRGVQRRGVRGGRRLDGDGRADIIAGAGPGGGPHVRVFAGTDGMSVASFFAFDRASLAGCGWRPRTERRRPGRHGPGAGAGGGSHVRLLTPPRWRTSAASSPSTRRSSAASSSAGAADRTAHTIALFGTAATPHGAFGGCPTTRSARRMPHT